MASKHLRLRILREFSCTGTECPASCCSYGWNIDVDTETYRKWQQTDTENSELHLLDSLIKKHGSNEFHLKHINNQCTHLTDDGLCSIQMNFGHKYIPDTCQQYPRNYWSTGKYSVESLNPSCPEVLKLLMNEKDENLFEYIRKPKTKHIKSSEPSIPDEFASKLDDYLNQVMRNSKYPVNILILTISKKIIDIVLLSQQETLGISELQKELNNVSQQIKSTHAEVENAQISSSAENSGRFWYLVYLLGKMGNQLPSALDKYQSLIIEKIENSDKSSASFESIGNEIKNYRKGLSHYLPANYSDLMRRYLRLKFVNNAFPRSPAEGNLIAGLLYCVLPYAFIQLYVWIAANTKGSLVEQDVIEIIYSVERKLDHNEKIYKFLSEHPELLRLDTYYTCLVDV